MALTLTTDERTELERRVRSLKIRAEDARRALREPVGRVHWAGTETAERWMGYVDGAIESGMSRRIIGSPPRSLPGRSGSSPRRR